MDTPDERERTRLRTLADYQFGAGAGTRLFGGSLAVERSNSGRPRQVHAAGESRRLVSLGVDGRFTLGLAGGERLHPDGPTVAVGEESVPFVRGGRNAFAKFVRRADDDVRAGDEVCVVHDGTLLGVGRAELPAAAMGEFATGVAVKIREGAGPVADDG
jgi:uncharacterized protein with predicted RNA binding PUA domain